ncbi:MAG: magnesium protoporphyrin IX methyltransferase [Thermostichales cyanobacterium SZTDM-1c_bins_54]
MVPLSEKQVVREYFNTTGFERWRRIYGQEQVNLVQQDIRQGHERTIQRVLDWLADLSPTQTVCDAGCGVGSLSLPLAQRGIPVFASDLSEAMVAEAQRRQQQLLGSLENPRFAVQDLEGIEGSYDVVVCLDVLIHYPEADALGMLSHLAGLARERLIFSFAPQTPLLNLLKKVGQLFPGASKTTRAYQHREQVLVQHLRQLGWQVTRRETIASRFYFAWTLETRPIGN